MSANYAQPDALVSTGWVAEHLNDPKVKLVEVDVDTHSYDKGHIKNAIGWNWQTQLQDKVTRNVVDPRSFAELCRRAGINNDDTVVLYGDNNNWFAAWALWQFKYHGHKDVRLMNGGRVKWLNEKDKPLTTDKPSVKPVSYKASAPNLELRAMLPQVFEAQRGGWNLVDVRSPDEFTGKVIAPPGMSETAQRGGHIPGAKSVPWSTAVNQDGTFKSADELQNIYVQQKGVDPKKDTIAYCRIGERSSHTWFVLKYLIGLNNVKNYDGSWTEYGNVVAAPIEKA